MWDDRAVSEVVGFILVFAIIIGSVGILYVTGFGAMEDFQQSEQSQNAERAMEALAENFDDIQRNDGVRYRAGELNLRGGTLATTDDGTNITITAGSDPLWEGEVGSLTYDHEGTTIVYQGGAIIRDDPSGERIARPPAIRCTDEEEPRAVISLLVIDEDESDVSITSASSQEVTADRGEGDVEVYRTEDNVSVSADGGPYEDLWNDAFAAGGLDNCDGDATSTIRITTISLEAS